MNLSENSVSDIVMDTPFLIRKFERMAHSEGPRSTSTDYSSHIINTDA